MKPPLKLPMWAAGIASLAMLCACIPLSWYALERFQSDAAVVCVMLLPCAPFLLLRLRGPVELPEVPPPLVDVSVDKSLLIGNSARAVKPRRRTSLSVEGAAFIVLVGAAAAIALELHWDGPPRVIVAAFFAGLAALVVLAVRHTRRLNRSDDED